MEYIMANILWIVNIHEKNNFYKRIMRIFNSFDFSADSSYEKIVQMNLYKNNIEIASGGIVEKYENILESDIYPILYAAIYKMTIAGDMAFVHSTVVCKDTEGILILGDFHSGKTTLALEFEKNDWIIASYDQTLIKINDGQVLLYKGSSYQSTSGYTGFIQKSEFKKIPINKVIIIHGVNEQGKVSIKQVTDFNNIYRGTWRSFLWPWITPLTNKMSIVEMDSNYIEKLYKFFEGFNKIKFYSVRGSVQEIALFFDREIKCRDMLY